MFSDSNKSIITHLLNRDECTNHDNKGNTLKRKIDDVENSTTQNNNYVRLEKYTTQVWQGRCKRLDDLWEYINKKNSEIQKCIYHVELWVSEEHKEIAAHFSRHRCFIDKLKKLSQEWDQRKYTLLEKFNYFKSESFKLCTMFNDAVKNKKSLFEIDNLIKFPLYQDKNQGKVHTQFYSTKRKALTGRTGQFNVEMEFAKLDTSDYSTVADKFTYYLIKTNSDETALTVQQPTNLLNSGYRDTGQITVPMHGDNFPGTSTSAKVSGSIDSNSLEKLKLISSTFLPTYYVQNFNERILSDFTQLFNKKYDEMAKKIFPDMDEYFDEMRLYNAVSEKILDKCVGILWPGDNFESMSKKIVNLYND